MYYKLEIEVKKTLFVRANSKDEAEIEFAEYLESRDNIAQSSSMSDETPVGLVIEESDFEQYEKDHVKSMKTLGYGGVGEWHEHIETLQ